MRLVGPKMRLVGPKTWLVPSCVDRSTGSTRSWPWPWRHRREEGKSLLGVTVDGGLRVRTDDGDRAAPHETTSAATAALCPQHRTDEGAPRECLGSPGAEAPLLIASGWYRWARQGSNLRPPACKAGALPLSYAPCSVRPAMPRGPASRRPGPAPRPVRSSRRSEPPRRCPRGTCHGSRCRRCR